MDARMARRAARPPARLRRAAAERVGACQRRVRDDALGAGADRCRDRRDRRDRPSVPAGSGALRGTRPLALALRGAARLELRLPRARVPMGRRARPSGSARGLAASAHPVRDDDRRVAHAVDALRDRARARARELERARTDRERAARRRGASPLVGRRSDPDAHGRRELRPMTVAARPMLLGEDALLDPLRSALADPPAAECELWAHRRRSAIARYSRSQIHQNAVSDEIHVHARAVVGGALGVVTTNPLAQAGAIGAICAAVGADALRVAGTHQLELTEDAVANTRGLAVYAPSTTAYLR